jgi:O-antigen biosynthesis protein
VSFEPLLHPVVLEQPERLTDVGAWHEHIPFAFFAVAALRPGLLVELGTHKGDSYCAFCQAVQHLDLTTEAYAVDTWEGDEHTGHYGPDVLEELRGYHEPRYSSFSHLLQETFDDAAERFTDGSVDLLHVDGAHGYDAVAADLERWLPKLGPHGVVLMHDTSVRDPGFGVWRLWAELSPRYPSFAFEHGHGLGMLAVGADVDPGFLDFLADARSDPLAGRFFAALGARVAAGGREREARDAAEAAAEAQAASELAAAERLDAADKARIAVERESERARAELAAAQADTDRLRLERNRFELIARDREADLAGVVTSTSWRLTAPLRAGKHRARHLRHGLRRFRDRRRVGMPPSREPGELHDPHVDVEGLSYRPLISVVTPVYNVDPAWLGRAVESVRGQSYPHWQLCLADDGSTSEATLAYLRTLTGDPRVSVSFAEENGGIAAATNRALEDAGGEFVAFLDHDDELEPDALLHCVRVLGIRPETDVVYTDEDKLDRRGRLREPFYKPDWSPELFRGVMYVGHLLLIRRSLVAQAGGLDPAFDGVQDFELMLRVSELTDRIEHVPRVLYHWRKLPGSIASSTEAKHGISELQAAAVARHLERCGIAAVAEPNPSLPHRAIVRPKLSRAWPDVTVIIPTKDAADHLGRCLESIFERSTYPSLSVVLVDTGTTDPEALALVERHPVEVIPFEGAFNFSHVNNLAVERARGDYVVFLNNDTEVQTPEWLEVMVGLAEAPDAGAVGPLLLYPNGTVQHAGVVLGLRGTADHIMRGFPGDADGYAGSLSCTREVSAVTAACMLLRREVFLDVGGFDEHFATHYQDVDLCLRLRLDGRRNLYTPRAVVRHHESATRGSRYDHLDRAMLLDRWGETIRRGDPYYNPALSLTGADYRPRAA